MNFKSVVRRIAARDLRYMLGRFRVVRASYSHLRHLQQAVSGRINENPPDSPTLFPGIDVKLAVEQIRDTAVYVGLMLPEPIVSEIEAFARSEPLHPGNEPNGRTFFYKDIERGCASDGRKLPLGGVTEPTRCVAIQRIVSDPVLRRIVRDYLGYAPKQVLTLLGWSFASDFNDEEHRRFKHHVIDYHYDVGGFNFVYANFYIVDTDRYSGAHVMMRRSHKGKPLRMLLGSAVASRADVLQQFGPENELVIEGPAGTGFVQDTSCFHRATPPSHRDRLMLAIRFS